MIPRRSAFFCLYDTRSLSSDPLENAQMVRRWMMKGVRHGELVIRWGFNTFFVDDRTWFIFQVVCELFLALAFRESDDSDLRTRLKYKAHWQGHPPSTIRAVNFVIFVVNGLSILKSMEGKDDHDVSYMDMVATTYNLPHLSFKGTTVFLILLVTVDQSVCNHGFSRFLSSLFWSSSPYLLFKLQEGALHNKEISPVIFQRMNNRVTYLNFIFAFFADDKPVVVVTHGDLLSVSDRARIRVHLGERLGIPPMKQIFDIPGK